MDDSHTILVSSKKENSKSIFTFFFFTGFHYLEISFFGFANN